MVIQPLILLRKSGSHVVVLALIASLVFLFLGPGNLAVSPSQAAFPGANGKIAFVDEAGIKAINPDGSDEQILLSGAVSPAWSPDGLKFAYVAAHDSGSGIFIADADGSDPEYITIGANPAWSPDGKQLVYMGAAGGLWIYNLVTHVETQLTHLDSSIGIDYHDLPVWQPGGNKIVFCRFKSIKISETSDTSIEHTDLWLVNSDGSGLSQLTDVGVADNEDDPGVDSHPNWSPNGTQIVFIRSDAEIIGVYTIGVGGGNLTSLVSTGSTGSLGPYPAWSPDGNKIAYVSYNIVTEPHTYEIHVMKANGENNQTILSKTTVIIELDWGISTVEHEFVVNSDKNRLHDNDPGDGACDTGDDLPGGEPECTLLAAVEESNALSGKDTIIFDIPGGGVPLIAAPDGFSITDPVVIDGSTQPGSGKVEIDGGEAIQHGISHCGNTSDPDENGFTIEAEQSTLRGLVIHGFCDWGIVLRGGNSVIEGNYIGTDATGTQALGNGGKFIASLPGAFEGGGISIESDGNLIGGTEHMTGVCDGACNLISGNSLALGYQDDTWDRRPVGIRIVSSKNNSIYGNFIGTDIAGQGVPTGDSLSQQQFGIEINEATENMIGSGTLGGRNLISGNGIYGIFIHDSGSLSPTPNNIIRGNFIGTDAEGMVGIGDHGVLILNSRYNQFADNVISPGGIFTAISISGNSSYGNLIQNNLIGTGKDGKAPIGSDQGISLEGNSHDNPIENNTIAFNEFGLEATSTTDGENQVSKNIIHSNDIGVRIWGIATGIRLSANSIYDNHSSIHSGLGIDLGSEGPTLNDLGDADDGPNDLLNFPVLGFAAVTGDGLRIGGTYDSAPFSHTYRIEFFANQACDPSGYGEGERFLGFADLTTDFSGRVVIDITKAQSGVGAGQFVTATAADKAGNTSEFSRCVETQFGTDLTADAGSSSTELKVSDTRGFLVGDLIRINPGGANQEDNRVVGFGSILLATPLQFDHVTGEPVILLSTHLYLPVVTK